MDFEQRQSSRFSRPFMVTNHEDELFLEAFKGFDVNLTGLSFWLDDADLFLPGQQVSLRIKNSDTQEVYCLESVEIIHQRSANDRILCGCHIAQVTSAQLLAHHRTVMTDAQSAWASMQTSEMSEFDFIESDSRASTDEGDFQQAVMALNLAVSQQRSSRNDGLKRLQALEQSIQKIVSAQDLLNAQANTLGSSHLISLNSAFQTFFNHYLQASDTTLSLTILAKLLAYTPRELGERQAWKTLITDFETRFLTEGQQIAYDFMHQGLSADEALKMADDYLKQNQSWI